MDKDIINKLKQCLKTIFIRNYDVSEEEVQNIIDNSPYLQKENVKKYFIEYDDCDEIEDELINDWVDDIFALYKAKEALKEVRLMQEGDMTEGSLEELFNILDSKNF